MGQGKRESQGVITLILLKAQISIDHGSQDGTKEAVASVNCEHITFLDRSEKKERLLESVDEIRDRFGFLAVTTGQTLMLKKLYRQKVTGYELRTPGLSK